MCRVIGRILIFVFGLAMIVLGISEMIYFFTMLKMNCWEIVEQLLISQLNFEGYKEHFFTHTTFK